MAGKNEIKKALSDVVAGKILFDEPMSNHTSLIVGGKADALVFIKNEDQLIEIISKLRDKKIDFLPVGNLTNIIVKDGGYRGAILLMTGMNRIDYEYTPETGYLISAQAGAALAKVVNMSVSNELTGLEFCAGIPGTVGGAVWMNAGAYGKEMKDVIRTVSLLDAEGEIKKMSREEISFSYRKTLLPRGAIILSAQFKLKKGEREKIKKKISEILQWRQKKHPLEFPNAGSIFKNLPMQIAGKLIEDMDLKGMSIGDAQVSTKHANFIVNKGSATAADILELIALIQSKAEKEKNVKLETEVIIVGED